MGLPTSLSSETSTFRFQLAVCRYQPVCPARCPRDWVPRRFRPDLAVTKTAAPSSIVVGENITYAIAVTNQGPDQATGVFVEDFLPQGVTFVSVSSSQGDCFQQTAGIACELGDLPPGTTATVELVGKATQAGTVNNSVTATGDEDDPDTANNSGQVSVTIGTG